MRFEWTESTLLRERNGQVLYGIHLSAAGAEAQSRRLEVTANNMANASTGAFKRDLAVFRANFPFDVEEGIPRDVPGNLNDETGGTSLTEVFTDFENGPILQTGEQLDVALSGPGFLKVSTPSGEFLTRAGKFSLNDRGEMISQSTGFPVLSTGGSPIRIPENAGDILISHGGLVQSQTTGGGIQVHGQLGLFQSTNPQSLLKQGDGLYAPNETVAPATGNLRLLQGHVEESGTRPMKEMVTLIDASRALETNLNMIKFHDESLSQLLQSVSR